MMNNFAIPMMPSRMGKESWSLGKQLKKVWAKHKVRQKFVTFFHVGGGTNAQWVFFAPSRRRLENLSSRTMLLGTYFESGESEDHRETGRVQPLIQAEKWSLVVSRVVSATFSSVEWMYVHLLASLSPSQCNCNYNWSCDCRILEVLFKKKV